MRRALGAGPGPVTNFVLAGLSLSDSLTAGKAAEERAMGFKRWYDAHVMPRLITRACGQPGI
ncbi:MAG: hypothetical protein ABJH34_08240, partial [Qipengyuania citrea]